MSDKEILDLAVKLAGIAIKNNSVKICKDCDSNELKFLLNTCSYPEGEKLVAMDFKTVVLFFKKQLEETYEGFINERPKYEEF